MNEPINVMQHLTALFGRMETMMNGSAGSMLHDLQKKSLSQLQQAGFPDRKNEDWKNTPVHRLMQQPFALARHEAPLTMEDIPLLESHVITIMNGKPVSGCTPEAAASSGFKIRPLLDAIVDSYHTGHFTVIGNQNHPDAGQAFQLMNFAFQNGGFVIEIPANTKLAKPIEIRIIHHDPEMAVSNPLYFIIAGKGSQATIIERFESANSPAQPSAGFINHVTHVHAEPNARITYIKWQDLPATQNLVYKLNIAQHRDSRFDYFAFDQGGQVIRNNVETDLKDQNTYTSLLAGFVATGRQSMDHQTLINHAVPHGESHEWFKGIVDDQATAAFNGKVFVRPDAQKTNAFQQNDTLVLSPHAVMNSKPQLEIFADDVKCSHGATIGQLDPVAVFYLRARGLDMATAQRILKAGFLSQIIDKIPVEAMADYIRNKMHSVA